MQAEGAGDAVETVRYTMLVTQEKVGREAENFFYLIEFFSRSSSEGRRGPGWSRGGKDGSLNRTRSWPEVSAVKWNRFPPGEVCVVFGGLAGSRNLEWAQAKEQLARRVSRLTVRLRRRALGLFDMASS